VFSVRLVFRDAQKHRHEPPTSQRSHSAVVNQRGAANKLQTLIWAGWVVTQEWPARLGRLTVQSEAMPGWQPYALAPMYTVVVARSGYIRDISGA
jgi:hypothetical protein